MFGRLNADQFLQEMITEGTATVDAKELRNLLIEKRKLEQQVSKLEKENELLRLRNISLKHDIVNAGMEKLVVTGIDVKC